LNQARKKEANARKEKKGGGIPLFFPGKRKRRKPGPWSRLRENKRKKRKVPAAIVARGKGRRYALL